MLVVDFGLDTANSVGEINRIITNFLENNNIKCDVVIQNGRLFNGLRVKNHETGVREYGTVDLGSGYAIEKTGLILSISNCIVRSLTELLKRLKFSKALGIVSMLSSKSYFSSMINKISPDVVIFALISPNKNYAMLCKKKKISYIHILYDTYVSEPNIKPGTERTLIESPIIANSDAYFIPYDFYKDYTRFYSNKHWYSKIIPYYPPMLINKACVINFLSQPIVYQYAYFGQIQGFRNLDKIMIVLNRIGIKIDIFTNSTISPNENIIIHETVGGNNLMSAIAGTCCLVVFDNSEPYQNYIPAKVIKYASFQKPILAFGCNRKSALITFLSKYPTSYYCNIDMPELSSLKAFCETYVESSQAGRIFDDKLYENYKDYLPENSLATLKSIIDNINSKGVSYD